MEALATRPVSRGRNGARNVGVAVWVLVVGNVIVWITTISETGARSVGNWVFLAAAAVVVAVLWRFVVMATVARSEGNRPAAVGVSAGIVGVLANVVFWTGLPFLLGAGALVLGVEARRRAAAGSGRGRMAQATLVLGAIATLTGLVFMFIG